MKSLSDILTSHDPTKNKGYISREFQDYGLRLAQSLNDLKNKSLYIKLAKTTPRTVLEDALVFVKDAYQVKSKAKLFMWKLKEMKKGNG